MNKTEWCHLSAFALSVSRLNIRSIFILNGQILMDFIASREIILAVLLCWVCTFLGLCSALPEFYLQLNLCCRLYRFERYYFLKDYTDLKDINF